MRPFVQQVSTLLMCGFFMSCFLLNMSASQANFAAWDDNVVHVQNNNWLTKESENFVITYPESNTRMANKALNIAERVHTELLPFFGQSPDAKTQMALVDDFDFSNGWATFFPFAQIRLFSSPPDRVNGLEVNDDWLHTLIRHEYVHVLHLEMERGTPQDVRDVFGRFALFFPHAITPSFMLEGLATYLETSHELGYGRLQGSYYAMQMRSEVAEQRLKSLGEVAAPLRNWPLGMQYLYGSYFYEFLAASYSEDAIRAYLYQYSGQIFPGVMQNNSMNRTVRQDFNELWVDYQDWLKKKFEPKISQLKDAQQQGYRLAVDLDSNEYLDQGLFKDITNSEGDNFYYIHNNGEDTPELRSYNRAGSVTKIVETKDVISLDVNSNKEVIASRMITWVDGRSWADVFLLVDGFMGKEWKALTKKSRLRNVRWLNNDLLLASRKVNGISELVVVNKLGEMSRLWRGKDETTVIGDYAIDVNASYLVASVKRAQQGWNLERLDFSWVNDELSFENLSVNNWQALTHTKGIENSPQILANGYILFSADYDGIYNLYLLDPKTQQLTQLTNMLSGAFEPKLILDPNDAEKQQIVFQAYTADGFEFRALDVKNLVVEETSIKTKTLADVKGQYNYPKPFSEVVKASEAEAYSPWSSLMPRWWFPTYLATPEASQYGLMTGGSDTLARHNYSFQFSVDVENELADLSGFYGFDNRYSLGFQRTHEYVDVINGSKPEYIIEQDRWLLARNNIVNAYEDQLSLNAAIVVEREGTVSRDELFSLTCVDANFERHKTCEKTLAGLGLKFDSREMYLNSPGFSNGRYFDLVYETNDLLSGISDSDYQGAITQGQWQEIFNLAGRRSLSLQVLAGYSSKDNEAITIGGEDRLSEGSLFGRDDYALRGYASSVQGGNNMNINRINFNQWLARINSGWGIWPIGAGDISTDLYLDYGSAWQDGNSPEYLTGVGIDFNIEVLAFYNLMMPIRISFARGLDDALGKHRASIGISMPY